MNNHTYEAIVIGAGMSGSWVAKELCDHGVKTLLLDRGPNVKHLQDYPTGSTYPWDFPHRGAVDFEDVEANPIVSKCYAYKEGATHFFVKDDVQPYIQEKPFDWIKGYQVGGKSLMWARQTQRWSQYDFNGPDQENFSVSWPISYKDIAPWYSHVEKFVGISGNKDGLDTLPDGEFLPPMELTVVEKYLQQTVRENYDDRHVIYGRCAHITEPQEIHRQQGRAKCQHRTICERGCPFGGYFSANSSTIPWAERSGNLTLRPDSVVQSIIYDEQTNKAKGVRVIDAITKESVDYFADVVFLNAGAINSNAILLNSTSQRFPNGLGNDNGLLGKYFGFHNYRARITATCNQFLDKYIEGKSPTSAYMPRFVNVHEHDQDFKRGYGVAIYTTRYRNTEESGMGQELIDELMKDKNFGPWQVSAMMMGETIPKATNTIQLDSEKVDQYGMPLVKFNVSYDDNDEMMMEHFYSSFEDIYAKAGFENVKRIDTGQAPGLDIHEMGGVRMGKDPETSLLNGNNQMHLCENVYVSDGACMTSTSTQNPSLTYMALAARAANHYVEDRKKEKES
ncbi:MAG: GMC family oxidoreductase [Saprospiraceae bacterium]|nr:GMC family oxidoreductase [Saprospiraceae bacterium]